MSNRVLQVSRKSHLQKATPSLGGGSNPFLRRTRRLRLHSPTHAEIDETRQPAALLNYSGQVGRRHCFEESLTLSRTASPSIQASLIPIRIHTFSAFVGLAPAAYEHARPRMGHIRRATSLSPSSPCGSCLVLSNSTDFVPPSYFPT